jgi:hypothetical protein
MIPHIISGSGTISMVVAGKSYSIGIEFSNYQKIRDLLLSGASEAEIVPLLDLKRVIKSALKGRISFEGDRILLDGKVLHNSLSSKIVDLFSQGYKVDHLLLFLE